MTEDRAMVMQLVLEGKLEPSYVTMEELEEVEDVLFELIAQRQSPYKTFEIMQ
jgi:inorganic pyrophosphatase